MPKIVKELSDAEVRRLKSKKKKPTYHAVGGVSGLLLQCRPPLPGNDTFARSWILRVKVGEKRRDIGLGGYPDTTLGMARQRAREAKELIRQGVDPVAEKRAARSALVRSQAKAVTFREVAAAFVVKRAKSLKRPSKRKS